ncbi:MAG: effector-binding domain-containing protein [Sphingobacteriales bacterium]|jgi:effector-binding domain-containing protein
MKVLKYLVAGILFIILLLVIVSFFLPKTTHVERSIVIDAPASTVFGIVNNLEQNDNWLPWNQLDPNMTSTYSDVRQGVGASTSWSGNEDVGTGTMTITETRMNEFVATDLDFGEIGSAKAFHNIESADGGVKVTWGFESETGTPPVIGRYFGLMMDNFIEADYEKGLANLKKFAESMPNQEVKLTEVPSMFAVTSTGTAPYADIAAKLSELYSAVTGSIAKQKLEINGMPFAIYHEWGETVKIEAGICTKSLGKSKGAIEAKELLGGKVAMTSYYGPYMELGLAHEAVQSFLKNNGMEINGSSWEVYETDPMLEPDSAKWLTKVYYPVK